MCANRRVRVKEVLTIVKELVERIENLCLSVLSFSLPCHMTDSQELIDAVVCSPKPEFPKACSQYDVRPCIAFALCRDVYMSS